MRKGAALAAGIGVGAAAAMAVGLALAPGGGGAQSPGSAAVSTPGAAPAMERPPTLAARGAPAPTAQSTTIAIDLARHGRRAFPPASPGGPPPTELWLAIVGALYDAEKPDEALAALDAAVAAGAPPEGVLRLLPMLPDAQRGPLLGWLRKKHPTIEIDPWVAATAADGAGDRAAAFEALLATLPNDHLAEATQRLARIDAAKADLSLGALARRQAWNSAARSAVAVGFSNAGEAERADRWTRDAADRAAEEALASVEQARRETREHPGDPDAWGTLARLLSQTNDRAGAIGALRRQAELAPSDLDAVWALAVLDPGAALPLLRALDGKNPSPAALNDLALVELRLGHTAEAMDAILKLPPGEIDAWWDAGAAGLAPARALARLEETLAVDRPRYPASLHAGRAMALDALGRSHEAFDAYGALLTSIDPEDLVRRMARVDPDRAATWFAEPHEGFSEDGARWGRAWARAYRGHRDDLIALAESVTQPHPLSRWILAAFRGGEWMAGMERAAKGAGEWEDLAEAYELAGRLPDAAAAWDHAVEQEPDRITYAVRRALAR